MASHNSAKYIQRALASIDNALKGRPYALVMADDASTDDTVKIARHFPMRAEERIIVTLPKATSIGGSKNRAVKLARPFFDKYPWVAFFDDDDEMLQGRFRTLLENMETEGQKAGIADWTHHLEGCSSSVKTGDWSLHTKMFSPGMTMIHRDLIPRNGDYFVETPASVFDDIVTHHRLRLTGTPICYHGGDPGYVYHQRNSSFTGGPQKSAQMLQSSEEYLERNFPSSRTTIASFCTVALGPSVTEAEILVKSLRITGNDQPIVVLTDDSGARLVKDWGVAGVETMICDPSGYFSHFQDFSSVYHDCSLNPGAFLGKMDVITETIKRHGTTLYLDSDVVVLRQFMDVIDAPIGFAPELSRSSKEKSQSSWSTEKFGYFSGGYVYATREGLHIINWWRREFLKSWRWFGSASKPHGGFTDQSCLDLAPLFGCAHVFHPGHNYMYTRVAYSVPPITAVEAAADNLKIQVGHGLYHRGWPLVTVHAHFRIPVWSSHMARALRQVIGLSKDPRHAEIYALISERS